MVNFKLFKDLIYFIFINFYCDIRKYYLVNGLFFRDIIKSYSYLNYYLKYNFHSISLDC